MSDMQPSKKLINSVDRCMEDCLQGLVAVNPGLQILEGHRVVVRADIKDVIQAGKVTLVCGGGSGHEPAHGGFVGSGMLSAAVAGAVFTSPPPHSILATIRTVGHNNPAGVLVIVKNYTGDRLNFGLAVERAKNEGIKVDMIVVNEDCALTSSDKTAGRRGLCGTILVQKIAGGLSEHGRSLEEMVVILQEAIDNMGTIGLSLTPCSVPGSGPSFQLHHNEMELGLGIHGEAGVQRMKLTSAKEAVVTMIDHMTNPSNSSHMELEKDDSICLVVNNLGGTSVLELNIVAGEAIAYLESKNINVERVYCGSLMTSLEMAGVSLTVLKLNETLRDCLDFPTTAPGWSLPMLVKGQRLRQTLGTMTPVEVISKATNSADTESIVDQEYGKFLYVVIYQICQNLKENESRLNTLDRQSGDGDCGSTMSRGAEAILKRLGDKDSPGLQVRNPHELLLSLAEVVEREMGGSSGALYSLGLTSAASSLQGSISVTTWIDAFNQAIQAIQRYGQAEPGDRTMLDALHPVSVILNQKFSTSSVSELLKMAALESEKGAESTAKMVAKAGRASYVSRDNLTQPDPGAMAVSIWIKTIYDVFENTK